MSMIEVKTSELIGAALDWAAGSIVAGSNWSNEHFRAGWLRNWAPSTDWSQGGPLIDEYQVAFMIDGDYCVAVISQMENEGFGSGSTHLIAAMRAIVAAKLGDVVSVPSELVWVVK